MLMKIMIFLLTIFLLPSFSKVLIDNTLTNTIGINKNSSQIDNEQERLKLIRDKSTKSINGIIIHVVDINIGKNSSLTIDYSPKLIKHGVINIDNKKETTIKYKYKF